MDIVLALLRRRHDRTLTVKFDAINFTIRQLFKVLAY